jgi:Flp pilus assembly protein TadG
MPLSLAATRNALRRFHRNRRGVAAVEFALVAPLFFGLLFAIIEIAMMFFASQVLETATQDSARTIMTGQAQDAKYTQQTFKDDVVCPKISVMFDCAGGIYVDVQSYPELAPVIVTDPIVSGSFVPPNNFSPGGAGNIVVVRLFYKWPIFITKLGFNIANLRNEGKRLLTATAAFKNEPF